MYFLKKIDNFDEVCQQNRTGFNKQAIEKNRLMIK